MDKKEKARFIAGYLAGFTLFYIAIPAVLIFIQVLAAWFIAFLRSPAIIWNYILAALLFAGGAFFSAWSNIELFRSGKGGPADGFGKALSPRTKFLVKTGPYRYTRNPMAFGTYMVYIALAVFLNSLAALVLLVAALPFILAYLRKYEETRLEKDFGKEFTDYRKKVPMFFPLPARKGAKIIKMK